MVAAHRTPTTPLSVLAPNKKVTHTVPNITPLSNHVMVVRDVAPVVSPGGTAPPDVSQEKANRGRVVAVGPGRVVDGEHEIAPVAVGDLVFFSAYDGVEAAYDNHTYLFLRFDDLFAVVPGPDAGA